MAPEAGCVLVASRELSDPNFMRTIVYLMEHDSGGSLGFIINRPVDIPLSDLWAECPDTLSSIRIACEGGPVERNKGLLIHACPDLAGCQPMGLGVAIGGDLDALVERFTNGPDVRGPRLFLGHSGWGPGQLAEEIAQGAWIAQPGTPELLLNNGPRGDLWHEMLHLDGDGGLGSFPEPSLN
jgi:putative transcriptional regulator